MKALSLRRISIITALTVVMLLFALTPRVSAQTDVPTPEPPAQSETENGGSIVDLPSPDIQNGLCAGVNLDVNGSCFSNDAGQTATDRINRLVRDIINIFSWVVGVVSVIMIIIGGFKYITSGGDSSNVTGAKNTILYAIIGLIIVALAQSIVKFVLGRVIEI